jgi:hypothetical protein
VAEPPNPDELPNLDVAFPRLADDSAASLPVPMSEVLRYLGAEAAPEEPTEADLRFLRTARVEDADYWIWGYVESAGAECYVTVSRRADGETTIGYDENYDGLTPEQFILGEYHRLI